MADGTGAFARTADDRRRALGEAIRRSRRPLTQTQLGMAVGRPQSSISAWEAGKVDLSIEQMARVEAALDLVPGRLLVESGYIAASTVTGLGASDE